MNKRCARCEKTVYPTEELKCLDKASNEKRKRKLCRQKGNDCKASVDIKIKKINKDTIRNDPFLKKGLSALVFISFKHKHHIHVAEAYSFLKISTETKSMFFQYFDDGLGPTAAKNMHEMKLLSIYSSNSDVTSQKTVEILADCQQNPKDKEMNYLYDVWRRKHFGDRKLENIVSKLVQKQKEYAQNGFEVYIEEDPFVVLIISPIMKRAHSRRFAGEICFIDSTGSCDQTSTVVTFIIGGSKVGGIPLACLLHTSQTESNYTSCFQLLKKCTPNGFGGNGFPNIIMTDDSHAERNALKSVYPHSKLLLCSFHICQAVWRWLCDTKNGVDKSDRKNLMNEFRSVLYASSSEECEEIYNELHNSCKYQNFSKYLTTLWKRKDEWCLHYRKALITRGHNTNNLVESSIRVLKDIILERCKTFNAVALLEFIINVLEKYHFRRLIAYANYRHNTNEILFSKLLGRAENLLVQKKDNQTYLVASSDPKMFYTVLLDLALCDCIRGAGGAYCKHICAVEKKIGKNMFTSPSLSTDDRADLAFLATGEFHQHFFKRMITEMEKTEENIPAAVFPHCSEQKVGCSNESDEKNDAEGQRIIILQNIEAEHNRILLLAQNENCSVHLLKKYATHLNQIRTGSQLNSFLVSSYKGHGRKIKVQPSAISRRSQGVKRGSQRMQSGRPAKKRSHSLATNINENKPSAKIH